jgi:hypothetical protein
MNQSREAHHNGAAAPLPRGGLRLLQVVADDTRMNACQAQVAQVMGERHGRKILE